MTSFARSAFPGKLLSDHSDEDIAATVESGFYGSIYGATKEAIRGVSCVATREWGPDGICVNVMNPSVMSSARRSISMAGW